jgi:hypothetical protein
MGSLPQRLAGGAVALLLAGGLGCKHVKPSPAQHTEPWPAPASATASQSAPLRLVIRERSEARFVLTTKAERIEGSFRVARGELTTDLHDLARTTGAVSLDLASVMVQTASGGDDRMAAETAQNWLGVGSSVPEAEREKRRWARFSIDQVENPSVRAPHQGKRAPRTAPASAGGSNSAGGTEAGETRAVDLDARGKLLLHGYEVELRAPLTIFFHYEGPPKPWQRPTRVEITTRSALTVSLDVHDVKPRDPAGNLLPRDLGLLGTKVGREASVTVRLVAVPPP